MAKSYTTITALAVTNLANLADQAYWVSPDVDNDTELAHEIEMFLQILTTTTAGSDGNIKIYIAGSTDDGTDYAGGITSESDATYTPVGDDVSHWDWLGSIIYTAETTVRTMKKRFNLIDVPKNFKYVVFNNTGTALGATVSLEQNAIKQG